MSANNISQWDGVVPKPKKVYGGLIGGMFTPPVAGYWFEPGGHEGHKFKRVGTESYCGGDETSQLCKCSCGDTIIEYFS